MITKHKNRYVLVESSAPVDTREAATASYLNDAIAAEMGHVRYLEANPKLVYQVNPSSFIVRVNRGYEKELILSLAFIKEVGGSKVGFYTLNTSGTVRALLGRRRAASTIALY